MNIQNQNHLINLNDYSTETWDSIITLAQLIKKTPRVYKGACTGKIMGTLFYEPSTRTQMSFQSAMLRLGGGIIGFDNPETSSISKGESLSDTAKVISGYSDVIVMRHYLEGAAKAAAMYSDCPIINAGDGGHLHPTQTLTDLLTLTEEKGRLTNLNIGICGDLKHGRTVHSLVRAVSRYMGNTFTFISTPELSMPDYIKKELRGIAGISDFTDYGCFSEVHSLEEAMEHLDVLYMTRIQRERFPDTPEGRAEYNRQQQIFTLTADKLREAKPDLIIMHPLPRVDEIATDVDADPRAVYFKQANYGMYVRMALILTILNHKIDMEPLLSGKSVITKRDCTNLKCVTHYEPTLPKRSFIKDGKTVCEYCDCCD
ncbi:MAG: aspartate carbamoyltransferase [Oscillospiraceae bacterium]|nr:aspartate carbamoyltransferase [Oscillospiraceae bacterium]